MRCCWNAFWMEFHPPPVQNRAECFRDARCYYSMSKILRSLVGFVARGGANFSNNFPNQYEIYMLFRTKEKDPGKKINATMIR